MKKLVVLTLLIVCLSSKNAYSSNNIYAKYDNETNQQELYVLAMRCITFINK